MCWVNLSGKVGTDELTLISEILFFSWDNSAAGRRGDACATF